MDRAMGLVVERRIRAIQEGDLLKVEVQPDKRLYHI